MEGATQLTCELLGTMRRANSEAQYNNRQRQAKGKDKNYAKLSFDVKMENNKYEQPGTEG